MNHHNDSIETILMELSAGIIPTEMFRHKVVCEVDPFEGMDLKDARKLKRKWRKLRRKHNVQKLKLSHASSIIRSHLRNKEKKFAYFMIRNKSFFRLKVMNIFC